VTKNFLQRNGLQLVVRSHEVKEEGYEVEHDGCCITIFSAPNYCDQVRCGLRARRAACTVQRPRRLDCR
jgi:hypothetical protein